MNYRQRQVKLNLLTTRKDPDMHRNT